MVSQQLVHQNGDRLFVTSLDISNRFGKQHKNVMQAIENLDCSPEFGRLNFKPSSYNNSQNKAQPMFELTRDGFVFLCMGFTGPQAALWKERYITAFNEMEQALRRPMNAIDIALKDPGMRMLLDANKDMAREVGLLKDMVSTQNQAILSLYQQVDGARRGHIRALTRLLSVQERQQKLLAGQEKREARETILRLEAEGVPRELIAQRTGRTLNHIRQVVWQARQAGVIGNQGELMLGGAA